MLSICLICVQWLDVRCRSLFAASVGNKLIDSEGIRNGNDVYD